MSKSPMVLVESQQNSLAELIERMDETLGNIRDKGVPENLEEDFKSLDKEVERLGKIFCGW